MGGGNRPWWKGETGEGETCWGEGCFHAGGRGLPLVEAGFWLGYVGTGDVHIQPAWNPAGEQVGSRPVSLGLDTLRPDGRSHRQLNTQRVDQWSVCELVTQKPSESGSARPWGLRSSNLTLFPHVGPPGGSPVQPASLQPYRPQVLGDAPASAPLQPARHFSPRPWGLSSNPCLGSCPHSYLPFSLALCPTLPPRRTTQRGLLVQPPL